MAGPPVQTVRGRRIDRVGPRPERRAAVEASLGTESALVGSRLELNHAKE